MRYFQNAGISVYTCIFLVLQAGLKLLDIPSIEHSGDNLGSVEFSETFLNSKIVVEEDGKIFTGLHFCGRQGYPPDFLSVRSKSRECINLPMLGGSVVPGWVCNFLTSA